jgi:hypothetical protein
MKSVHGTNDMTDRIKGGRNTFQERGGRTVIQTVKIFPEEGTNIQARG